MTRESRGIQSIEVGGELLRALARSGEPMMLRDGAPVASDMGNAGQSGIIWTYFHWGPTAWAMYCVVAICAVSLVKGRKAQSHEVPADAALVS